MNSSPPVVESESSERLEMRVFGEPDQPTLMYIPGIHGDWTLVTSFRIALRGRIRFVEMTYPRTLTWTMHDYAHAIAEALRERGITRGWLLAESFGSQPAWALLEMAKSSAFQTDGLILASGFVKHPLKHGPRFLGRLGELIPMPLYLLMLKVYAAYARFRHRHAPETLANIREFVARRTVRDREAMRWRLHLLDEYDPRPIARQTRLPVYYLAGLVDPLVPWPFVRRWLRKNCPGYRGGKTFCFADHNVLATSPKGAAEQVLDWMKSKSSDIPGN